MSKKQRPTIETERLTHRPYTQDDAPALQTLLSEWDVASATARIPHPYKKGMAEEHIKTIQKDNNLEEGVNYAITHRKEGFLIGGISLNVRRKEDESMSLGYWIGKPYWNQGYCTEAVRAIVKYGFNVFGLHRVYASHFGRNPASGRVLQKIGMKYEGTLREAFQRWGKFEDVVCYGILKSEYDKAK